MDCPVCRDVKLAMTDRQGIEIDYCPQCRGVWLDRGELDKLIERASGDAPRPAPPPPPPQHDPRYREPRYTASDPYRQKKKKNLLGELFDF
jgi:Zn-finger nucleic acid-binding protein